ncbi:MAG: tRNA (N(6)-L-threonylcarbamoyladenosine(37)-C(2))-methylthiotransferase MtaB [Candidatus Melainabacteria bacterium GWA2_34_9]|nr:MAG: tRNA (N(6)-L-threonylcarbamoyladenosine(37)-C(2))-methylthiotransferase MtaB [Candidatus Melainabacteria bacterium GWA2_34_9]
MKKIAIHTLGCRANQLESSIISDKFMELGWEIIKFSEVADVYVINTCSVTGKSDNESRYYARKAKKTNPDAKIILCGCYTQVSPEEAAQLDEVDLVLGNTEKLEIAELITNGKIFEQENKIYVSDIMQQDKFQDKVVFSASGRTRANIKVQDGCNFRCSYCIVPYARGKSRSNELQNIINQVNEITKQGFQELVLSGIHLGQWGLDLTPKTHLADLIKEIEKIESLKRFRLSSIDPMEFTDELIETITNSEKFCRHLHISLQSGNNEILKAMRRRYNVEYYNKLIEKLDKNIPDIAIGSDIIIGFPGETQEQFEDTCENLKKLPISYIHVFSYSKRKGTPAGLIENQVPENIKKERNKRLTELAKKKNLDFRESFIGKNLEVLIELARDKKTGLLKGMTDNFIPVLVDGSDDFKNKIVSVKIKKVEDTNTFGKFI